MKVFQEEEGEWFNRYCPEHEILRRQYDGMELLKGNVTEHGYWNIPNDNWARYLRVTHDLQDYEWYKKNPSIDNPWWAEAWGVTKNDIAIEVVERLAPLKMIQETRETWPLFMLRKGGTLPPMVPEGDDYVRQIATFLRRSHDTIKRGQQHREGLPLDGLGPVATGSAMDNRIYAQRAKQAPAAVPAPIPTLTPIQQSKFAAENRNDAPRGGGGSRDSRRDGGREGGQGEERGRNAEGAGSGRRQRNDRDGRQDSRRDGSRARGVDDGRGPDVEGEGNVRRQRNDRDDRQRGGYSGGGGQRRSDDRGSDMIQSGSGNREGNSSRERDASRGRGDRGRGRGPGAG